MNRQNSINRIAELLALFVQRVKASNAAGAFDINRFSEDVLIPIFAEVYDYKNLLNLNTTRHNYPAIDLGDETARVSFQITSNSDNEKIKTTLEKFIRHKQYENYDRLIIYDITEKESSLSNANFESLTGGKISFSRKTDVQDYTDLLKKISSLPLNKIQAVENILVEEFEAGTKGAEALKDLRALSRVVATDAGFVTKESDSEGNILLGDNLYVTRAMEGRILTFLHEKKSKILLVIGEAGRGKTSLLWNLFNTLKQIPETEPWFIKSTMLKRKELYEGNFETILYAAEECRRKNQSPVLLLDTIDLLLHDEASRDLLVGALLKISESGCTVVATSRPQEVSKLPAIDYQKITLLDYQLGEFEEAIYKHVARFYAPSAQHEQNDYAKEILEAVGRGLPIREVCINPLTLRMLFTIYAPTQIPKDINIFKLYKEYWNNRVEKDFRAGTPFAEGGEHNLEEITSRIAIYMLAEGVPEIRYNHLRNKLDRWGVLERDIERLISRGIIRLSGDNTVAFFHQTFFEHSAACGLLRFFEDKALDLLKQRIESEPNDLFTSPIYEQALLLAADFSRKVSQQADANLLDLFKSKSISSVRSTLYVYCHRENVPFTIDDAVAAVLKNSDEATQIRFIELAPNTPPQRLNSLFDKLELIWQVGTDRTKEHLLNLILRLVPRNHKKVIQFVERHKLFDYVLHFGQYSNAARTLLSIIGAVSYHNPTWGWENLIRFCEVSTPITKGRELATSLIDFLCKNSAFFDPHEIATKFERDTSGIKFDETRNFDELSEVYGNLWSIQWRANNASVPDMLEEIENAPQRMGLVTRMKGFVRILVGAKKEDAEFALTKYSQETAPFMRALWREIVIPRWLAGNDAAGQTESDSVMTLRSFVKRNISPQSLAVGKERTSDLIYAIMHSNISQAEFLQLIDPSLYVSADDWLKGDILGPLLAHGIIAEHPGAMKAAKLLAADPRPYWSDLSGVVGMKMIEKLSESDQLADIFFDIVIKASDGRLILRNLEKTVVPPQVLVKRFGELLNLSRLSITNRNNPPQKRYGLMIMEKLLKLGAVPVFEFVELIDLIKKDNDHRNQGFIISIIGRSARSKDFDLENVIDELRPFAAGQNEELRRAGLLALIRAVSESESDISDLVASVVDVALSPPLNAERLTALRPLIERLLPANPKSASATLQKLITAATSLGNNGKNKLFGRLKPMVRKIVKFSNIQIRREILKMAPNLDRILACLVVDAICHESLSDLSPELDQILESNVPGEVKETIILYRYTQEREFGGKEWVELHEIGEELNSTFFTGIKKI